MLDGTGDTECKVDGRTHGLTGLSDLAVVRHDAGIHHGAGRRHLSTQYVSEPLQHLKALFAAHAAAAGYQHLGFCDIHGSLLFLDGLDQFDHKLALIEFRSKTDQFAFAIEIRGSLGHYAGAHGGHLRTVLGALDGGHQVAAECRTGHFELMGFLVDGQLGTVGGQAGAQTGCNSRRKVAADGRGTEHQDRGFEHIHSLEHSLCVGLREIILQQDILYDDDLVGAISDQRLCEVGNAVPGQQGDHLLTGDLRQFAGLSNQFKGNRLNLTVALLCEYVDIFIIRKIHSDTVFDG